jgi:hypothetical protein
VWKRPVILLALASTLGVGACAGGNGGIDPTSTTSQPASSSISIPSPSGPAAVGLFRACHKRHDNSIVLVLLFENRDRALLGGFPGALGFRVSPLEPATWSTTGRPVTVDPGRNDNVRQITVPAGQPAPPEVKLDVTTTAADDPTNVLATNHVTIPVPATSCTSA